MNRITLSLAFLLSALLVSLCFVFVGQAQAASPVLITQSVDESKLVTLAGNTRPEARAKNDHGPVADSFPLEHMLLQLKRSAAQERELEEFIDDIQDKSSSNFHHWITAKEFGERFGLSKQELATISSWLQARGFTVNVVYDNGMLIDFSGTAGQVRAAFHTEIHELNVKGVKHIANMSDPKIPVALAPAVAGIVSLHDFMPHGQHKVRTDYTVGNGYYLVAPPDLATIYNLNPLFSAGISGQGQTIVLIEDTDLYSTTDWNTFRSTFGLSSYTGGSLTQIHPAPASGPNNCIDPKVNANGDDMEAALDVEYASAAAPSAAIELASCTTTVTFGGLIALQNVVNGSAPPALISMSYGECEAYNGAASNAAYNAAYQQAVTEGVSVFVSAGDEGASLCSYDYYYAFNGIGVSGFASTPYNVAVGGTDYGDTYAGTNSTYWSPTNNSYYGSALSYVPEIPWNDSCASQLIAQYQGYSQTWGPSGFCNNTAWEEGNPYFSTTAGSGGPSGCATGTPAQPGIVGGTCAGWPKPSWQSLVGNPSDGVRDLPDVSLFAANGIWGHYYPFCLSDPAWGYTCTGAPDTWIGAGGTSFSSPIMAGIQALVNQKTGERQGNPNPVYYSLAASEYGASGDTSCNSTLGNAASNSCIFYDVTLGDMDVPCFGLENCFDTSGTLEYGVMGVLSTSNSAYQPAYGTSTGWDFATGIGTINAANLVNNWPEPAPNFTLAATPNALTIIRGNSATSAIAIVPQGGFNGSVNLSVPNLPTGVTAAFNPNPASSNSTLTLTVGATAAPGTLSLTIAGTSGTLTNTTTLSLTITEGNPSFTLSGAPNAVTIVQDAGSGTSTISITPLNGFSGNVALSASGLPKGVTAYFNGNPATSSSVATFTASQTAKTGTATVTITGTSGGLSASMTITLTVNPLGNFALRATPKTITIARGSSGTSTIVIVSKDTFDQSVNLIASGLPKGVTASLSPNPTASTSTLTLTVSGSAAIAKSAITITGIYGTLSHQTFVTLTVTK